MESAQPILITSNENKADGTPLIKFDTSTDYIEFQDGSSEFENTTRKSTSFTIDFGGFLTNGEGSNIVIHSTNESLWTSANFANKDVRIKFSSADVEAHYQVGAKMTEGVDWQRAGSEIKIHPDQIIASDSTLDAIQNRLLIRYEAPLGEPVSGAELVKYYSPVVRDLVVVGATVDPRLAGLEDL